MKDTAYIFSIRKSDKYREKAFKFLLTYIKENLDCKIIVVEQDEKPRFKLKKYGVKHIFLKNDGPFDKAWSYNVAVNNTEASKLIFGDADIFIAADHLKACVDLLDEFEAVDPKYFVWDLSEEQTKTFFKDTSFVPKYADTKMRKYVTICGGMVMFQKKALEKISGWTELCRGWGGEDDIQAIKTNRFLKTRKFPGRTFHLYHPSAEPVGETMNEDYLHNIGMVNKYRKEVRSVHQIFELEPKNLGNEKKYEAKALDIIPEMLDEELVNEQ